MGRLKGKEILLVVGQRNYNEEEFQTLFEFFGKEGANITITAKKMERALGRLNGYVTPDLAISEVVPDEYDAVILVGGYGARVDFWEDSEIHELLKKFARAGKIIGALEVASVALANAGLLQGKRATTFPDYDGAKVLPVKGAKLVHEHVVTDDNIITSMHPKYTGVLAEVVIEKLIEKSNVQKAS